MSKVEGNHYVVEVDQTAPAMRIVNAKTRNGALQYVAQGVITVRLASAREMYEAAEKKIEIEDAMSATVEPSGAGRMSV